MAKRKERFGAMRHSGVGRSIMIRSVIAGAMVLSIQMVAMGQDYPPVETETLSTSQKSAIALFVSEQINALKEAENAQAAFAAQAEMLELMRSGDMSVEYRQEISKSTTGLALMVGGDMYTAIGALVIAGELAVRQSDRTIKQGLNDPRESVRVAAAGAAKRMMHILAAAQNQKTFRAPGLGLQRALADALEIETSANAARSIMHALASTQEDTAFYVNGGNLLTKALVAQTERLRAMPVKEAMSAQWSETVLWGVDAVRRVMIEPNPQRQISDDAKRNAARVSGLVLAIVSKKTIQDPADASRLEPLVNASEQVLLLVEANFLQGGAGEQAVAPAFKRGADGGDWGRFQDAVESWVGPRGRLTRPPFGFAAANF